MLGSLLLRSFGRSRRIYSAMLARGYAGEVRTLEHWRLGWLDLVWIGGCLAGLAILVSLALIPGAGF